MKIFVWFSTSIAIIVPIIYASQVLYMADMQQCPGKDNLIIQGLNFTIEESSIGQNEINGLIVLKEPLLTGFRGHILVKLCTNMTNRTTCNPFYKHDRGTSVCNVLKKPHIFLKNFVKFTTPPLICPLQPGTYHVVNFKLPNELTRFMPKSKGQQLYFYNRITGTKGKQEVLCFEFFSYVANQE